MLSKRYEIRIKEALDPDWTDWFAGMEIRLDEKGNTVLAGDIKDQSALHGLLARVQRLNLTLLSINPSVPSGPSPGNENQ